MSPAVGRREALPALLLLLLVMSVYGMALGNGFVYDDHSLVKKNLVVRTLDPLEHLSRPFWGTRDILHDYYRPAVTWLFAVDRVIYDTRPWGYHLTNLLLHWLNALLLFRLFRRIAGTRAAGLGAALFAVHPVQSEAVVFVSGRTDLLATLFVLLAVSFYSRIGDRPSRRDWPAILLFAVSAAAALLSKEMAATFPALLVGFDLATSRADGLDWPATLSRTARRLALAVVPVALLIAGYLGLRYALFGGVLEGDVPESLLGTLPFRTATHGERLFTAVHIAGRYLGLVVFPRSLSVDYEGKVVPLVTSVTSPALLLPLLALLAVLTASLWLCRRQPLALFGLPTVGGTYLLVSHVLFPAPVTMAERTLYLPMCGVAALFAAAVGQWAGDVGDSRRSRTATAVAVVILALLGARGFVRTFDWKDDRTLIEATIRTTPDSAVAWKKLGEEQLREEDYPGALESFRRAETVAVDTREPRRNQAIALRRLGRLDEAQATLERLTRDFPESQHAWLELIQLLTLRADLLAAEGRADEAHRLRLLATRDVPERARAAMERAAPGVRAVFLANVARNRALLGETVEAGSLFDRAVADADEEVARAQSTPESARGIQAAVLNMAAQFRLQAGQPAEAARLLLRMAEAHDAGGRGAQAGSARLEAGRVMARSSDLEGALQAFRLAAEGAATEDALVEARRGMAGVLMRQGRPDEAVRLADDETTGRAAAYPAVLLAAAEAGLQSGRAELALPLYDRLVALQFSTLRSRHGRARARLVLGDLDAAELELRELLAGGLDGRIASAVWTDLARVAAERGDPAETRRRLERAVREDPGNGEARELLRRLG